MKTLQIDPSRKGLRSTGLYVRAQDAGRWVTADLADLDTDSLMRWLRSRGGENPWAEATVLMLLGHDPTVKGEGFTDEQ